MELPTQQQDFIRSQIAEGAFASEDAVITEALRMMEMQALHGWTREAMEAEIQKGLDDFEAGRVVTAEESLERHKQFRAAWLSKRNEEL